MSPKDNRVVYTRNSKPIIALGDNKVVIFPTDSMNEADLPELFIKLKHDCEFGVSYCLRIIASRGPTDRIVLDPIWIGPKFEDFAYGRKQGWYIPDLPGYTLEFQLRELGARLTKQRLREV